MLMYCVKLDHACIRLTMVYHITVIGGQKLISDEIKLICIFHGVLKYLTLDELLLGTPLGAKATFSCRINVGRALSTRVTRHAPGTSSVPAAEISCAGSARNQ